MVIKTSKLRPRQKRYSSDSESPIEFSVSSDESVSASKPQNHITERPHPAKPNPDNGLFKSPGTPNLNVNKKKVVRTYGTKLVSWASIACSTPITEKPINLKHTAFSPIETNPSPGESSSEEKGREDSNWCTYSTEEEKKSKGSPSKHLRKSLQKKSLTSIKHKLNTSHVGSASQEVARVISEESVKLADCLHNKTCSRDADPGVKHHSGIGRDGEHLASSRHEPPHSMKAIDAARETTVDEAAPCKEVSSSNANELINAPTDVPRDAISRESKIPTEYVVKSPVGSKPGDSTKVDKSSKHEARESTMVASKRRKENESDSFINSRRCSPRKSGLHGNNKPQASVELAIGTNPESTTTEVAISQKSSEKLHESVTSPPTPMLRTPHKNVKKEKLKNYIHTRSDSERHKKYQKDVNSSNGDVVSGTAEEPVRNRATLGPANSPQRNSKIGKYSEMTGQKLDTIRNKRPSTKTDVDIAPHSHVLRATQKHVKKGKGIISIRSRRSSKRLEKYQKDVDSSNDEEVTSGTAEEPVGNKATLGPANSPQRNSKKGKYSEMTGQKQAAVDTTRKKRPSTKTDVDTGIRKSKRQRLAPLKYWKGERIQYEAIDHPECKIMYKIVGIVRPRVDDTPNKKVHIVPGDNLRKKKKYVKKNHTGKVNVNTSISLSSNIETHDDMKVKIPMRLNDELEDVVCVSHLSKTAFKPFVLESGESVDGIQYQTSLSLSGFTNGLLKISSGGGHKNELNEAVDLFLFVAKGKVDIMINGHTVHARPGSSVIIPRGILYKITNDSDSEALLSYVTKSV